MFSARSSAFQRIFNISNRHAWSKFLVHAIPSLRGGGSDPPSYPAITFTAKCSILAGWKNPRRGVYRRVRLHFAQSSSGHRSKCRMRFLLGPCGALCAQIWPLGGQNRARGTFASLRTDGEISEVPRNNPFFHQLLGRNKHFPAFPSMIRACYGRCESLTTFQCQVVENEAWPQTDGSLASSTPPWYGRSRAGGPEAAWG